MSNVIKYTIYRDVDPNHLEETLNEAGKQCLDLVHVQPLQKITAGMQINGQPVIKIFYQLIFKSDIDVETDNFKRRE